MKKKMGKESLSDKASDIDGHDSAIDGRLPTTGANDSQYQKYTDSFGILKRKADGGCKICAAVVKDCLLMMRVLLTQSWVREFDEYHLRYSSFIRCMDMHVSNQGKAVTESHRSTPENRKAYLSEAENMVVIRDAIHSTELRCYVGADGQPTWHPHLQVVSGSLIRTAKGANDELSWVQLAKNVVRDLALLEKCIVLDKKIIGNVLMASIIFLAEHEKLTLKDSALAIIYITTSRRYPYLIDVMNCHIENMSDISILSFIDFLNANYINALLLKPDSQSKHSGKSRLRTSDLYTEGTDNTPITNNSSDKEDDDDAEFVYAESETDIDDEIDKRRERRRVHEERFGDDCNKPIMVVKTLGNDTRIDRGICPAGIIKRIDEGFEQLSKENQCHSLLKELLTKPILEKLKPRRTLFKSTLFDLINYGFSNLDDPIGIRAPDADSYHVYRPLTNLIIRSLHGKYVFQPFECFLQKEVEKWKSLDLITGISMSIRRNYTDYPFTPTMSKLQFSAVSKRIESIFLDPSEIYLRGVFRDAEQMTVMEQQKEFLEKQEARFWPVGRSAFKNWQSNLTVVVNDSDHIRIVSKDKGNNFFKAYSNLVKCLEFMSSKTLPFARDSNVGNMSVSPARVGTTLDIRVSIRIPKVSAMENFARICNDMQLKVVSLMPCGSVMIRNRVSFGIQEYFVVKQVYDGVVKLVEMENAP